MSANINQRGRIDLCILGARGQLGQDLVCLANEKPGYKNLCALDYEEVDITDAESVGRILHEKRPRIVINAAAYTDVDGCERKPDIAWAVNAEAPGYIARACTETGCRLIHISTDFVFDGMKRAPYEPDDAVNPLNVYGQTKADGEQQVRRMAKDYLIVRTSWLFSSFGTNFVKTILRLAGEREELRIVNDQIGSPTYARDLANALLTMGEGSLQGIYHFCNKGACSWYSFAKRIIEQTKLGVKFSPISSEESHRPAKRPPYSVLSTEKLSCKTGLRPRPWQEALDECLEQLAEAGIIARPAGMIAKDINR